MFTPQFVIHKAMKSIMQSPTSNTYIKTGGSILKCNIVHTNISG